MRFALGKLGIGISHWYCWLTLCYQSFALRLSSRQLKRGGHQRTETVAVDIAGSQAATMDIALVYQAPRSSLSGTGRFGDDESKSKHGSATINDMRNAHDRVNSYRSPPKLNTRPIQPI